MRAREAHTLKKIKSMGKNFIRRKTGERQRLQKRH